MKTARFPLIISITPTICRLMEVELPKQASSDALGSVISAAQRVLNDSRVERFLVYAPDAIGLRLYQDYRDFFQPVLGWAPVEVRLLSTTPTKTPVCFASMFTGALPKAHGITRPIRPVLTCDTLFDALTRSGRRVAIVAVKGSSIDLIFRGRPLDYFSESYDDAVTSKVLKLIESNRHEFILAYHQEYDDVMHRTEPRSPEALGALRNHIKSFDTLAQAVEAHWQCHSRAVLFAPDHGAHLDPSTGRGTHGEAIFDDLEVVHFFGFHRSKGTHS